MHRSVQMGQQGSWNRWNLPERKITWQEFWQYEPLQLFFLLRSVYGLLPTPTNLERWKLSEDPSRPQCKLRRTLQHVLTACPTALSQGRYRWRLWQYEPLQLSFLLLLYDLLPTATNTDGGMIKSSVY